MTGPTRRVAWPTLDPRTLRLLLVGAASYLGRLGTAIALLVNVPLARATLDSEMFGIWMMLSALLGFFAFADLGVGNGVLNRITAAHAGQRRDELAREMVGGYVCTGAIAVALLLAWVLWLALAGNPAALIGQSAAQQRPEVVSALGVFIVLLALNLPASLIQKIQLGAQQGHWVGVAQFFASMATLAAIPATLLLGGNLTALVFASLGMQVLANVVSSLWWLRRNGYLSLLRPDYADREVIVALLRSSALFFALQLAAAFAFQSDAIVISHLLGPAAYGDFAVVQRLFLLVSAGLGAGMTGLWPAFGEALARGDRQWARQALVRGLLISGGVAAVASLVLIATMGWITAHWLPVVSPPSLALTAALGAWTVVETMGAVGGAFMNGANLLRVQLVFALSMASLAFAGKWWATGIFGTPGAVLATLCAYSLISVPGQIYIFRRVFARDRTMA